MQVFTGQLLIQWGPLVNTVGSPVRFIFKVIFLKHHPSIHRMPFKHPSEKYKRARERRKEAIASGKYCCPNCQHLLGDGYSLKRHVKSCPPLSTIIVPTSVVEVASEMSTVIRTAS